MAADPERTRAETPDANPPSASLLHVAGVVLSSFFGIRKGRAMQRDAVTIKPAQVIVVGILGAALLVLGLVLLVRYIVGHA
jgi:hypothetical protein